MLAFSERCREYDATRTFLEREGVFSGKFQQNHGKILKRVSDFAVRGKRKGAATQAVPKSFEEKEKG
ncbi:MAG: hypothetical protein LBB65_07310 [Burkholderiales bacterium]|nr:hypothetical protein [Burkholderiales bacterium]